MIKKYSFPSVSHPEATRLILGSLPGDQSIRLQEYYGHPQNRFWRVMASLAGSPLPMAYDKRLKLLENLDIALWDVAKSADREGSMDTAIRDAEPNDIERFIKSHHRLKIIAFNGQKAEKMYDRFLKRQSHIQYVCLPSTSPANARKSLEELIQIWKKGLDL